MDMRRRSGNRLLDRLPGSEYARLMSRMAMRTVPPSRVIKAHHQPIRHVYFVLSGLVSEIVVLNDGTADVGLVGAEGMLGLAAWLGVRRAATEWRSHTEAAMLQLPVEDLPGMRRLPAFSRLLTRYAAGVFLASARLAACNGVHSIDQRLPRWLLTASDRAQTGTLPLSHRAIAQLLGVRRAGISEALSRLARLGTIRLGRSAVSIRDRAGLQRQACVCYRAIRRAVRF